MGASKGKKNDEDKSKKEFLGLELAFFIFILLNILSRRYESKVFDIISIIPWIYIIIVVFRGLLSK